MKTDGMERDKIIFFIFLSFLLHFLVFSFYTTLKRNNKTSPLEIVELLNIENNEIKRPDVNSEEFIECQALGRIAQRSIDRFYILMLQLWRNEKSHISINELEIKCRKISKNLEARHSWLMPEFSEKWTFDLFINHLIEAKFVKKDISDHHSG